MDSSYASSQTTQDNRFLQDSLLDQVFVNLGLDRYGQVSCQHSIVTLLSYYNSEPTSDLKRITDKAERVDLSNVKARV